MAKPPKFQFGQAPKNFSRAVTIQMIEGEADIEFSFIYRTRAEFAAMVDENMRIATEKALAEEAAARKAKKSKSANDPAPASTVVQSFAEVDKYSAEFILKIADGWDLDDPLNVESLTRLENENPGSMSAIGTIYRQAVAEARTKNS
jgi:hypothetical protein